MTESVHLGETVLTAGATALPLGQLPICDIVDLLLLALVRHKASAVTIEPAGHGHAIRYERGTSTVTLDTLTPERGDAVVMRLAIIFGIAVGSAEEQIGRLRIRGRRRGSDPDLPTPPATEILVAVRPTASGLSAELHRFAGPEDEVAGGELGPTAGDGGPEGNRRIGPYRITSELGRGVVEGDVEIEIEIDIEHRRIGRRHGRVFAGGGERRALDQGDVFGFGARRHGLVEGR